jgi:hypothetical protein
MVLLLHLFHYIANSFVPTNSVKSRRQFFLFFALPFCCPLVATPLALREPRWNSCAHVPSLSGDGFECARWGPSHFLFELSLPVI